LRIFASSDPQLQSYGNAIAQLLGQGYANYQAYVKKHVQIYRKSRKRLKNLKKRSPQQKSIGTFIYLKKNALN
jgi:hypothetical protein